MNRFLSLLVVVALVVAGCSGSDGDPTTTSVASATTTTTTEGSGSDTTATTAVAGDETTTTAVGTDETTTTTAGSADTTITTAGTTANTAAPAPATFVVSRVVFGSEGYVAVTNVGGSAGDLEGWQLCQRPGYYGIGSVVVAPGETVRFTSGPVEGLTGQVFDAGGRFGQLSATGGEIGLYVDGNFGSASSIRSYVEWGSSDHGRSSVAVEAGIWVAGGFVSSEGVP
ncbi:MAG: hypothetical protein KJN73_04155, partial [Acidimicrobiia bacterium]|nr:hypothetical protein [Acidimicrobiia bacterium]NNJ46908.1 hypothetical protein [Acidimicrobiia bacterium]